MSKVYLVASGKGGTGKTMFSVNLGASYAQKGYRVVVVDMDMGLRNLDLYLGLENNVVFDVYDVVTGVCPIRQALIRDRRIDGLYMIGSSPERDKGDLTPLHIQVLCEKLKEQFDYIIIDSPSGIDDGLVLASAGADAAIIVTTPEYAALRDADAVDRELVRLGVKKRYLVLNKLIAEMMNSGYIPRLRVISSIMRAKLIGIIQFDMNINISTNLGQPIVLKKGTYIQQNFENICDRLIEEEGR
ncbi:septum site-determining protein MinD [Hornefia butyriciproducens]|jgi:septum site-determining protein MinD|uniref:Septum site-determining protein MinD n=1 Tax=Hornefia butyriciproducens TaxID=2652293 RepID=A0A6L5Y5G7_9FIRM|nr:septum site-determining protein MinD [Hornefia butyriciproducens]MCI7326273.1 septum site-determining protein MinD [Clostridiales bacterium]MDD6298482.1 septum site-determining protein MinD [Hornefia butyriciproducens]MDD7020561.1 septum site-determining protein MinD [Hornefia butyriciproducens]MDY5423367.1 septum site-determining protein MinD [Hornefia butyriciproducens]MST51715.1 septum site-determining protein MinD [Hornefia butyriciproducens]